ncbi:hypothetical protein VPH35_132026 [Triticum aestivum]
MCKFSPSQSDDDKWSLVSRAGQRSTFFNYPPGLSTNKPALHHLSLTASPPLPPRSPGGSSPPPLPAASARRVVPAGEEELHPAPRPEGRPRRLRRGVAPLLPPADGRARIGARGGRRRRGPRPAHHLLLQPRVHRLRRAAHRGGGRGAADHRGLPQAVRPHRHRGVPGHGARHLRQLRGGERGSGPGLRRQRGALDAHRRGRHHGPRHTHHREARKRRGVRRRVPVPARQQLRRKAASAYVPRRRRLRHKPRLQRAARSRGERQGGALREQSSERPHRGWPDRVRVRRRGHDRDEQSSRGGTPPSLTRMSSLPRT